MRGAIFSFHEINLMKVHEMLITQSDEVNLGLMLSLTFHAFKQKTETTTFTFNLRMLSRQ